MHKMATAGLRGEFLMHTDTYNEPAWGLKASMNYHVAVKLLDNPNK